MAFKAGASGAGSSKGSTGKEFSVGEGRYQLVRKIGSGSFGDIYFGIDRSKNKDEVAVKIEPCNARHPQLKFEAKMYQSLQGGVGIPRVRWF